MQMGEPAGILFFINENIVRLLGAEPMPPDLHRAVIVVELDVEKTLAVLAPDHAAIGFLDEIVKILSACPVADPNRKIFRSLCVGAPAGQSVIRGMPAATELEAFVVGG